ncbi:MAG: protein-export chaperone SecB [Alphaproteobacteria bacterium]|nr:protein-export chaperone SecB [Alphaproteobacteria bacterium]MBN2779616.1 protein-export chaperone SecB [Alphaproteobacteria bacterium]
MAEQKQEKPPLAIISQFVKDFSFEAPNSPQLFFNKEPVEANLKLNIDIKVKKLNDELFTVDLVTKVHNTTKKDDKSIFMIELVYSGLVGLNMPEEEHKHALLVQTPQYLFPAVRALISRITSESGFPPFNMALVDFEAMYKERQKKEN